MAEKESTWDDTQSDSPSGILLQLSDILSENATNLRSIATRHAKSRNHAAITSDSESSRCSRRPRLSPITSSSPTHEGIYSK